MGRDAKGQGSAASQRRRKEGAEKNGVGGEGDTVYALTRFGENWCRQLAGAPTN